MKVAILLLAACSVAYPQKTHAVFHFTNLDTAGSFQEATNVLRAVAGLDTVVPDLASKTITADGSTTQIALADWLALRLDRIDSAAPAPYQVPGSADDFVQIIGASGAQTPAARQELVNVIRTAADLSQVFPFNPTKSIVVRGAAERVELASWLTSQLLAPPLSLPAEFLLMNDVPRHPQKRIHVYIFHKATSPAAIQEIVNGVRVIADVNRVFPFNQTHALVARGNDEQIAICDWLVSALDKMPPGSGEASAHIQIVFPQILPSSDTEERVLYLPASSDSTDIQQLINRIRTDTGMNRVLPVFASRAISFRGNAAQAAKAEEIAGGH